MTNQAITNRSMATRSGAAAPTDGLPRLEPLRFTRTRDLEIGYFDAGPENGEVVLLLHGFPYDIHSYVDVIPLLVAAGRRVIVPYLRGHGPTRFLDEDAPHHEQDRPDDAPPTGYVTLTLALVLGHQATLTRFLVGCVIPNG